MKSALERIYLFCVICSLSSVFATLLGGYTSQQAGGNNMTPLSQGNSNPILFALNAAIACGTILLAYPKIPTMLAMLSRLKVAAALYILSIASVVWSINRTVTARNDIYLCMYLVSTLYISIRFPVDDLVRLLGDYMAVLAIFSLAWQIIVQPSSPYVPGWSGAFLTKNGLGLAMGIGIVALIAAERPWNSFRIGSISLCVSLLLLSQSFTSILATLAGTGILIYTRLKGHSKLILLTSIVGVCVALSALTPNLSDSFSDTTGRNMTLTGRTVVWSLVLKSIAVHPLLGYGYSAFWHGEEESINQFINWKPGQAHNGYLEICLDLGTAGLVSVLLLLFNSVRRAWRLRGFYNRRAGVWMLVVVVFVSVHNFAESDFMQISIMWFIFLITSFSCLRLEHALLAELIENRSRTGAEYTSVEPLVS